VADLLVLGSGVAGLSAALRAASAGLEVVVLTKGEIGHSATRYAQGGVAAAMAPGDTPDAHLADTLAVSGGTADADAVRVLVGEGPRRIDDLIAAGAVFDRTGDADEAALAFAREGGHSAARVVHAGGDATGAEVERALVAALSATGVDVREGWFVLDLVVEDGRVTGVSALDPEGRVGECSAAHTLMASGGAGQLFSVTTNPTASTGDGIAMALRAGALVADVEFMQFHPTALHHESMPRPLLSEALRGDGAILRDDAGETFMAGEHPLADLAPRDVVSRCIALRLLDRGLDHLWLDATGIEDFPARFPTIWGACRQAGLDPAVDWLPVAPAAHYLCGGVMTDLDGATSLPGLWAVGEVACTGVHGANRLASNSLLEGLVFGPRAVDAVVDGRDGPSETGVLRGALGVTPEPLPARPTPAAEARAKLQATLTQGAGVLRSREGLEAAATALDSLTTHHGPTGEAEGEVANLVDVAQALVTAALRREESRGCHTRREFPGASPALAGRFVHAGGALSFVPLP
jgi:L-aspartate oxidase